MRGSYPSTTRKCSALNNTLYFFMIFLSFVDRAKRALSGEVPTILPASSSLLKNPSPSRVCRDSVFLSRIGGGWHAGRICGSERAVFVYRARGAGADEPST